MFFVISWRRARAGLSTSPTNRLKYWEKIDVSHFHDMLLRAVADSRFKPYHAQGVDMSRLTPEMNSTLTCFIGKIVKDLDRHRPWVIKDPRMLLFADQWIAQVQTASFAQCSNLCIRLSYALPFDPS